jgi:23S rRNA pseudouridine1911/1915/1917 synthase
VTSHERLISPAEAGARLDAYLGRALGLSRAKVKELFEAGQVRVDGRSAKKGQSLTAGQKVTVVLAETGPAIVPEPEAALSLLHVDAALVFIDKPAGVPSHPLRPGETGTVANALVARLPECADASEDPREGGLCHRLDVETSGVLLAARSRPVWTAMRERFTRREVDKRYWAVAVGPLADEGEIDLPLRHHPRHPDRVEADPGARQGAREAFTAFKVLSRSGEAALVEARITTGVLHQIRAHFGAIGAPLLGDALYGGRPAPGLNRFFLHARSLQLPSPDGGTELRVVCPLPRELLDQLNRMHLAPPEG